ncbi:hypothetical protein CANARDRAFT_26898 [[Candida] arabinofermentans NRRL YB-2248]|uniref:Symplekin/Pta1 N-terminal domain-containing protein n=1 Tax=[Candida] arabinofermentans NRRL YB-2248 TaxID=983967 RepID=A0A1E4T6X9_9ASCO|nr:hypothetical protein CANARDRAFT_26898 [[Candida] arabinofermentans NRRL YB-2248]
MASETNQQNEESLQITQLLEAEKLALENSQYFEQILDTTISICLGTSQSHFRLQMQCLNMIHKFFYLRKIESVELRRKNSTKLIDLLDYFIIQTQDQLPNYLIIQKCIEILNSVYDLVFVEMIKTPNENQWLKISKIRDFIIDQWPTSYPLLKLNKETDLSRSIGCKNAIIKLIGKVIQTHLPSPSNDSEEEVDVSTSMISENHIFLNSQTLNTQAQSLLDSLLDYIAGDVLITTPVFSTIISTLMVLFKTRPKFFSSKFLSFMLGYESQLKRNPHFEEDKLKVRMIRRFNDRLDKCFISFLLNRGFISKDPNLRSRFENKFRYLVDKAAALKQRGILDDSLDEEEDEEIKRIKRRKLEIQKEQEDKGNSFFYNESEIARSNDYKSIYSLINPQNKLSEFDMSTISPDILSSMVIAALTNASTEKLVKGLNIVFNRYKHLSVAPGTQWKNGVQENQNNPQFQEQDGNVSIKVEKQEHSEESDDDYDPTNDSGTRSMVKQEYGGVKLEGQAHNGSDYDSNLMDQSTSQRSFPTPGTHEDDGEEELNNGAYILPMPKQLELSQKKEHLQLIINNFIDLSSKQNGTSAVSVTQQADLKKVAISNWDDDSWVLMLSRLATRGLNNEELSTVIRETLFDHFKTDLKGKIDGIIEWLNEEYYCSLIKKDEQNLDVYIHYCTLVLDNLIPFLEASDRKIFIRLLSELPYLTKDMIWKIRSLCADPARSKLGFQSLLYLIMFRPPVVQFCIGLLKDIYQDSGNNEGLQNECRNYLKKYAPEEQVA